MTRKIHLILGIFWVVSLYNVSLAQEAAPATPAPVAPQYNATPKDMWEFGANIGHMFTSGDLDYKPGFGLGLHLRKSLDYVFSLRGDLNLGLMNSGGSASRFDKVKSSKTTWVSGGLEGVISFNSLLWRSNRKFNLYAFMGAGLNYFTVKLDQDPGFASDYNYAVTKGFKAKTSAQAQVGPGVAYKINDKFNIFAESAIMFVFGARGDYVEGVDPGSRITSYRDAVSFTSIGINVNLGNKEKLTQPLWWTNPLEGVLSDIAELKARPKLDLTDTDGDGVIDMLDQEKETPAHAPVDTRGVALDSDGDGYADYKDKEPYSPPGFKVDGSGVANVPKPKILSEGEVNTMIDTKLAAFKPKGGMVDWFLPMVHFDFDKYGVNRSEFEKLHYVASVLNSNKDIKIVVTGFTDKTASEKYNNVLSYNRAQAAIDFLVKTYNISRDRFILNWNGENSSLVPSDGRSYMNRRAEFRVAGDTDKEMARPEGPKAGKPGFSGNKNDGY